jgi:hypothetical protein
VAEYTDAAVEESAEWTAVFNDAGENRVSYCKAQSGKAIFSALYGTYTVTLSELRALLKASTSAGKSITPHATKERTQEEGFQEVRRRKRHSSNEAADRQRNQWQLQCPPQ